MEFNASHDHDLCGFSGKKDFKSKWSTSDENLDKQLCRDIMSLLNEINGSSGLSAVVKWDLYPHFYAYPHAVAGQSEIYATHNSLPERRTSQLGS